jgi:hypothetical protein
MTPPMPRPVCTEYCFHKLLARTQLCERRSQAHRLRREVGDTVLNLKLRREIENAEGGIVPECTVRNLQIH